MIAANSRPKLLAIDLGSRELGYACFEGEQLVDYGVKVQPRNRTPKELLVHFDRVVLHFIAETRFDTLALVQSTFAQAQQHALVTLARVRMTALVTTQGVTVAEYTLRTIRHAVCANGDATNAEQAKVLVERFPELRFYISMNRRWRRRYYQQVFDAVACGLTHLNLGRP